MSIDSWAISKIVDKLSFITLAVCPCVGSIANFYVLYVVALVLVVVMGSPFAFSVSFTFEKLTFVYASIAPRVTAYPFEFPINKLSLIFIAIDKFLISISIFYPINNISFIVKTIVSENYSFTSLLSLLKITNISIILLINVLSISVRFAFFPLSIICCE